MVQPAVNVSSMRVRSPWWRMAARRLYRMWTGGGPRWPSSRRPDGKQSAVDDRRAEARPMVSRKAPLAVSRSVLRNQPARPRPLTAGSTPAVHRSGVAMPSVPPPPGLAGGRLLAAGPDPAPERGARASLAASSTPDAQPPATAEQRWRAAVASVPLESPRAFPTSLRPMVARLAGSASRASYTSGPATRRALSAAGALGATTGSVVHLSSAPSTDPAKIGVLAHELSHARNPVARPRFMLRLPGGALDADERSARSIGDRIQSVAGAGGGPVVQRLFGGASKALGGLRDRATSAATGAVGSIGDRLGSAAGGIGDRLAGAAGGVGDRLAGAAGGLGDRLAGAAGGLGDRLAGAAGGIGDRLGDAAGGLGDRLGGAAGGLAGQAGDISAGLVDRLRVGGAGAAGIVDAARSAGSGLLDSASGALSEVGGGVDDKARAMLAQLDSLAGNAGSAVGGLADDAMSTVAGGMSAAEDAVGGAMAQGQGLLNQAQGALSGGAAGLANRAMGAAGGLASAAGGLAAGDVDKIVEALEDRLLRELERRGGRYAGVF